MEEVRHVDRTSERCGDRGTQIIRGVVKEKKKKCEGEEEEVERSRGGVVGGDEV